MKSYKTIVTALTISGMLVASMPAWTVEAGLSVMAQEQRYKKTIANLDAKTVGLAKNAMKKLAGKDVELYGVEDGVDGLIFIYPKSGKAKGQVVFNQKTGKIYSAILYLTVKELDAMSPSYKNKALAELKKAEPKRTIAFHKVSRVMGNLSSNGVMTSIEGNDINVTYENDTLASITIQYDLKQVNPKMVKAAQQAMKNYSGTRKSMSQQWIRVYRSINGKNDTLSFQKTTSMIEIDTNTGKVVHVSSLDLMPTITPETEKKCKKISNKQISMNASVEVKQVFGINIQGYSMKRDRDTVIFHKKGAPTVTGKINMKGQFWSLSVTA